MGLLIQLYVIIFLLLSTYRIYSLSDKVSVIKIGIVSSLFPIYLFINLLNIPLSLVGIYLKYEAHIFVSEEDYNDMTDND